MSRLYNRQLTLAAALLMGVLAGCGQPAPAASPAAGPSPTAQPSAAPSAAPAEPTATPPPLAAVVNGQPIPLADLTAEAARCQASGAFDDCPARALQTLIEQAVVEQAAAAAGLAVSDAERDAAVAAVQQARGGPDGYQAWLSANGYTPQGFAEALRRERLRSRWALQVMSAVGPTAEQVRAGVIVVADEATARVLLEQLQAGADFANLAVNASIDLSSRVAGGDLGWFPRGWLTAPEVEAAAFALQPGETSEVIPGELGYYIVRTLERDPARELGPDKLPALRERAFQRWLAEALDQAAIERRVTP